MPPQLSEVTDSESAVAACWETGVVLVLGLVMGGSHKGAADSDEGSELCQLHSLDAPCTQACPPAPD